MTYFKVIMFSFIGTATSDRGARDRKVIVLVGASGTGKTTCIDALMNYLLGVKFEDKYRVRLVSLKEEELQKTGQHESQTEWVTAYNIPTDGLNLDFDICVIDTPGFGDTRGIEQDKEVFAQLGYLFTNTAEHSIDDLSGICVTVKASDARLTVTQKPIFDNILSLFGKDVADNILSGLHFLTTMFQRLLRAWKRHSFPLLNILSLTTQFTKVKGIKYWRKKITSFSIKCIITVVSKVLKDFS